MTLPEKIATLIDVLKPHETARNLVTAEQRARDERMMIIAQLPLSILDKERACDAIDVGYFGFLLSLSHAFGLHQPGLCGCGGKHEAAREVAGVAADVNAMPMERFNQLLNGPLAHPLMPFRISRLGQALAFVVSMTGQAGARALELWCRDREAHDKLKDV